MIQNAFPIIEKYLDHIHTIQGQPIIVHNELNKTLIKNLQDVLAMYDSGVKLVFPNVREIKNTMEQELKNDQGKQKLQHGQCFWDLSKIYREEDLFPKEITTWEQRNYGFLFYNEENKDSFDSNHAIIFREKISDLKQVLNDITVFYKKKGIKPSIYQSICEEGYFAEIQKELLSCGFECWTEEQKYMVLCEENTIIPNADVTVQKVSEWKAEYGTEIFMKAGEPWEIDVAKRSLLNSNTLFFVASYKGKFVGMTHCHITDGVCRVDYLLVSKECRNIGVGRALISSFVEYCNANQIDICYLWPDGETAERIYYEAGFRCVETKQAGRATYNEKLIGNKS